MSSRIKQVVELLRDRILSGDIVHGERIGEIRFAEDLAVSRTPIRLALEELEREGLVERAGKRGFRVRAFPLKHVSDAIDVRGTLEGMAGRILAENGMSAETERLLSSHVEAGAALLRSTASAGPDPSDWAQVNAAFHQTLIEAAGNQALLDALKVNAHVPLASPAAVTFTPAVGEYALEMLREAQRDHETLLRALKLREASRAEAILREHARRSRDVKMQIIEKLRDQKERSGVPELARVV
ncbi:MAG: GntR family transcriptional regulator [Pseudomonadota bacterium]